MDDFFGGEKAATGVVRKECSTALSPSHLPGLDYSLNPYTKCGHDCTYCYAPHVMRTSPAEWGRCITAKVNIPKVLAKELPRKKGVVGLGTVTDPYQPVEEELGITRRCLEELARAGAKVSVLTKSDLVLRDTDILRRMPGTEVGLTINTISDQRAAVFEANAPPPSRRLAAVRELVNEGVDAYVFLGPVIPTITDVDLEALAEAIARSGARSVMIDRLNLRPGMKARMVAVMNERSPSTLPQFQELVDSDVFYHRAIARLKELFKGCGLRTTDAF